MPFCPHCGATTHPGMTFCSGCGATLPPSAPPPAAQPPPYAQAPPPGAPYAHAPPYAYAPPPAPRGPVGRTQEPWIPVVLTLVTFGIYAFVYWWRVTREADERMQRPGHAHKLARIGILLGATAFVLYFALIAAMLVAVFSTIDAATGEPSEEAGFAMFAFIPFIGLVWIAALAGYIMLIVAQWRVWTFIQQEEQRTMRPDPINPALMLVLTVVPFVNIVGTFIALYMTQERLNRLWQIGAAELAAPTT